MKTLTLNIEDSIFDEFIIYLNQKYSTKINIIEDDIFTVEDEEAYNKAIKELENGEAISLEQLKEELYV